MNTDHDHVCSWFERVSSMIDGELDAAQVPMVRIHADGCPRCSPMLRGFTNESTRPTTRALDPLPFERSRAFRLVAIVAGIAIVVGSFPGFIRGNTSGDALHDLRHLSIWQVAIGVAVATAGITTRFSRLILVMAGVFLVLTGVAVIYDLATGHRGPWADPTHVFEVVAAFVLARFALPYSRTHRLRSTSRRFGRVA